MCFPQFQVFFLIFFERDVDSGPKYGNDQIC